MTHPGLDTEPATATHCRHCATPVIQATTDGLTVTCDPDLLDTTGQIRAHLDNRATYELLTHTSGHLELLTRTATRIAYQPHAPVIATHRCPPGQRLTWKQAAALPAPVLLTTRRTVSTLEATCPPF